MLYALIKDGIVNNIIVADAQFIEAIENEWEHIEELDTEEKQIVGVNWTWDEELGFGEPSSIIPDVPELPVPDERIPITASPSEMAKRNQV
jgi:hypothetical protein